MKIECKRFDLLDLNESQVSFIAESFFSEAQTDFDGGYMSLSIDNYETAYELFRMLGNDEWYQRRAQKCQDRIEEIKESQS